MFNILYHLGNSAQLLGIRFSYTKDKQIECPKKIYGCICKVIGAFSCGNNYVSLSCQNI